MESISKSLGRILKGRRLQLDMSQATVARLSGKAQAQIANLENGLGDPRLSSVVQVSRALGCEVVLVPVRLVPTVRSLIEDRVLSNRKLVGNDPEDEEDDDE
jgi:predicted transcriptional regulator